MSKDEQVAFMVGMTDAEPVVMLGIPPGAWEYMKGGHTHTFDLSKIGLPFKILLFGAESHDAAMKTLLDYAKKTGIPVNDQRGKDFSI